MKLLCDCVNFFVQNPDHPSKVCLIPSLRNLWRRWPAGNHKVSEQELFMWMHAHTDTLTHSSMHREFQNHSIKSPAGVIGAELKTNHSQPEAVLLGTDIFLLKELTMAGCQVNTSRPPPAVLGLTPQLYKDKIITNASVRPSVQCLSRPLPGQFLPGNYHCPRNGWQFKYSPSLGLLVSMLPISTTLQSWKLL